MAKVDDQIAELRARLFALEQRFDLLHRDVHHAEARKNSAKELADITASFGVSLPAVNPATGIMWAEDVAAFIEQIAAKPSHKDDRNAAVCERAAHLLAHCGWSVP
jgi:hypothetical protein